METFVAIGVWINVVIQAVWFYKTLNEGDKDEKHIR